MYIYQRKTWPDFTWELTKFSTRLGEIRHRQGKIQGQMQGMGFKFQEETMLQTLTIDVIKTSEIEGEVLNPEQVRSSIARRLGIEVAGIVVAERAVDGVVEMMLDATQHYDKPLTEERLFGWHGALFPTGRSGLHKIKVGCWREDAMHVTSGAMGREKIHFEAPTPEQVSGEMHYFLNWMNHEQDLDPVIKAAVSHLWFVTVHPFDGGNGRIARAIADLQLARADKSKQRFYSMSAQLLKERSGYYDILEHTQKGGLDITLWLEWFMDCLFRSMDYTEVTIDKVLARGRIWEINRNIEFNMRQQKMIQSLLDDFFGTLKVSTWAKMTKTSTDTALRDIQELVDKGILEREGSGRSTSYHLKSEK